MLHGNGSEYTEKNVLDKIWLSLMRDIYMGYNIWSFDNYLKFCNDFFLFLLEF